MIGNVPEGVGVPMVSQFGAKIPNWNVKVPHYENYVFIFANKFLSQSGAILVFNSDALQILKQIKENLNNYSMLIQMKRAVVNNLPFCNTKDLGLKVHLPSHILLLLLLLLVFFSTPQCPVFFLQTLFNQVTILVRTPQTFEF
jgi:hypothetical protein